MKIYSAVWSPHHHTIYHVIIHLLHCDIIQWKYFLHYWPFVRGIHQWTVNSPHKGQRCGSLMFFFINARTNDWVNNRNTGDLRCHRANYDVTVMLHTTRQGVDTSWYYMFTGNRESVCEIYLHIHSHGTRELGGSSVTYFIHSHGTTELRLVMLWHYIYSPPYIWTRGGGGYIVALYMYIVYIFNRWSQCPFLCYDVPLIIFIYHKPRFQNSPPWTIIIHLKFVNVITL